MSTADSNNIGIKLQAAGENLNTWGDPNLNNDLIVLSNLASKWLALAITGDTTVSETNYSTSNTTEVAVLRLTASTVAAAFNLVLPSRPKRLVIRNDTGYAATIKLAATSGFALPTGRTALVATDGTTDVYNVSPNFGGTTTPTSGSVDIAAWSAIETAIATAALPATSGTVLVSATDTTAKYAAAVFTTTVGSLTTTQVAGLTSLQFSTVHGVGNQQLLATFGAGYVGGFLNGGLQSSEFIPVAGTAYDVDCTSAGVTVNLGGMTTPQLGHEIKINKFGNNPMLLKGTVNGVTNATIAATSNEEYRYSGSTWGWN